MQKREREREREIEMKREEMGVWGEFCTNVDSV